MQIWQKKEVSFLLKFRKRGKIIYSLCFGSNDSINRIHYSKKGFLKYLNRLWKKIQQLTAENQKLKDFKNQIYKDAIADNEEMKQLKQYNQHLQEQLIKRDADWKIICDTGTRSFYYVQDRLEKERLKWHLKNYKLKQENQRLQEQLEDEKNMCQLNGDHLALTQKGNESLNQENKQLQAQIAQLQENQCNPRKECMLLLPEAK